MGEDYLPNFTGGKSLIGRTGEAFEVVGVGGVFDVVGGVIAIAALDVDGADAS